MTALDLEVIEAMRREGGSFVASLAEAFAHADPGNFARLRLAFSDYLDGLRARGVGPPADRAREALAVTWPSDAQSRSIVRDHTLERIANERIRQLAKWGVQRHAPAEWVSIAAEELGEAAERANKASVEPIGDANPQLELIAMMRELVEVAAVCVAAIEDIVERYPELTKLGDARRYDRELEGLL